MTMLGVRLNRALLTQQGQELRSPKKENQVSGNHCSKYYIDTYLIKDIL